MPREPETRLFYRVSQKHRLTAIYTDCPSDIKHDLEAWCGSAHAAIEAAVYNKTLKSSRAIDTKLTELFEALGRISKILHSCHNLLLFTFSL